VKAERREIADLGRPEELFSRLRGRRGLFFLDSGLSINGLGTYSFIGCEPYLEFAAKDRHCVVKRLGSVQESSEDPLRVLRKLLHAHRCERTPDIPFPGGAVGFVSYEFGARLEKVTSRHADDWTTPDLEFGFYDGLFMYDHAERRWSLVACAPSAEERDRIFEKLGRVSGEEPVGASPFVPARGQLESASFTRDEYLAAIERVKDYIASGDVYQVSLTQRFQVPLGTPAHDLYLGLRQRSPGPYACYFKGEALELVSSSPEQFLRIRGNRVETRPIKGTRRRDDRPAEDARLADELVKSAKDRAELLMIVDLERNDLGRVCMPGSVVVEELYDVEAHPTVHHLVARVTGTLRADRDAFDCFRAAFPGGSITGAPKIRAMQIIDEIERTPRGVYTGAIGYFGFDGDCDLNIAIRTVICRGSVARYHVGGGIVWDSDPAEEYQETLDKAAAMRAALAVQT
jgi:para-aminobenzoate synthetase component 1